MQILCVMAHKREMTGLARNPKQIGALIRRARKKRALSQKDLGDKAGLRQETISLIETGNGRGGDVERSRRGRARPPSNTRGMYKPPQAGASVVMIPREGQILRRFTESPAPWD